MGPVNPTNLPDNSGSTSQNWFQQNGLYVAIGGGVIVFVLLVAIGYMCYKRKYKADPYMMKTYSTTSEEAINLDEEAERTDSKDGLINK